MITRLKCLSYLFTLSIILGIPIDMLSNAYAQGPEEFLDWSIETSKKTFYPGEPVLLIFNIKNNGKQEQEIYYGGGGIEAFSMEIFDSNNTVVAKGGRIQRPGVSRFVTTRVPAGLTGTRSIVLNRWCSTLLPPGTYHVICNVDYGLVSELTAKKNAPHPQHNVRLELDFQITKSNTSEFKKIIEALVNRAFTTDDRSAQGLMDRQIAENSLAFTESSLGVPHQLRLLRTNQYTWLRRDVINSLVRSKTLDAGKGLVEAVEDPSMKDVKRELIDAVYRLRETGKSDIIKATDGFVLKYKRPVLTKPID